MNRSALPVTKAAAAQAPAALTPGGPDASRAACWNAQGVYGDRSCPELQKVVHCRNCAVYSNAGVRLLSRPLPPEYRHQATEHYAVPEALREIAHHSAILFRLRAEWFALPTHVFQEVAEQRLIHSLPHRRRGSVLGLANVRGEIIICISLGHWLGMERIAPREMLRTAYHRLLVVRWQDHRLGFPVDEVHGPHRFHARELRPPPATVAKSPPSYARHLLYWEDRTAGFLDADRLFSTLNRSLS